MISWRGSKNGVSGSHHFQEAGRWSPSPGRHGRSVGGGRHRDTLRYAIALAENAADNGVSSACGGMSWVFLSERMERFRGGREALGRQGEIPAGEGPEPSASGRPWRDCSPPAHAHLGELRPLLESWGWPQGCSCSRTSPFRQRHGIFSLAGYNPAAWPWRRPCGATASSMPRGCTRTRLRK